MSQLGNLSPEGSVAIGVLVCLLSSGIQSVGLTLQRKSHMLEDENYAEDTRRPPYRRRRWQVGFSLFLVANLVGSTIQLTTLPLPVLAALQAGGLVFNSICATLILGEAFTRYSLGGTVLVSAGAVLIAYFGALPEPAHSLTQLLELFARKQFVIWAIGQGLLICAIFGGLYLLKTLSPSKGASSKMRLARGMCYGSLSGILSAHSLLMAKSAVELLVRTVVDADNQFSNWQAWIILLALICIGLSQLYCLHAGLQLCSTSVLYPFIFCIYNVITILDGLIYFNQSSQLSKLDTGLIILGTLILLSGVFCLSYRLAAESSAGPLPPEITENPLTPPVGFIGSPIGHPTEHDPLIPKIRRSSINRLAAYKFDEESAVETAQQQQQARKPTPLPTTHADGGHPPERLKLDKIRKRATFADYGTNDDENSGTKRSRRASANPMRPANSTHAYQRARRKTLQDSSALWGELEEAPPPRTTESQQQSHARHQPRLRRASDVGSVSYGGSHSTKHGDPGHHHADDLIEEEEQGGDEGGPENDDADERMASSTPLLLYRSDTGHTYRHRPRQRRSSEPGLTQRSRRGSRRTADAVDDHSDDRPDGASGPAHLGLEQSWHTIDSSAGRPSDVEEAIDGSQPAIASSGAQARSRSGSSVGLWAWLRGKTRRGEPR